MTQLPYLPTLKVLAICLSFFFLYSCDNTQRGKDSEEIAKEQNEQNIPESDNDKERDAKFLVKAAEINLEEIQLGKLAQTKGSTAEVKDFGKRLEDAHTKALADLSALASRKGIAVPNTPTKDAMDAYNRLNDKSAGDFDKDFCDTMVRSHKNAIDEFEKATKECKDSEIVSWATSTLPELRMHLTQAEACQESMKNM